jgi:hypothetical protein
MPALPPVRPTNFARCAARSAGVARTTMTSTLSTDSRPKPLRQCALGRPAINNQSIEIDVSIAAEVGVLPIFPTQPESWLHRQLRLSGVRATDTELAS